MLVIASEAGFQNFTLQPNRPEMTTAINMGILHLWLREKYAPAFPSMLRSIFRHATSARSCRTSICSAVNFELRVSPQLACLVSLSPVPKRLLGYAKSPRPLRHTLPRLHQPYRFQLVLLGLDLPR